MSLREAKRRATYRSIVTTATSLVEEKGFDAVTVEDICAVVGISRRTFFNYVDSKDSAVLGKIPRQMTEEEYEQFADAKITHLSKALLVQALELMSTTMQEAATGLGGAELRQLISRRKKIIAAHPRLARERMTYMHGVQLDLRKAATMALTAQPELRILPELPVEDEARLHVGVATLALQLAFEQWTSSSSEGLDDFKKVCVNNLSAIERVAAK